MNDWKSYLNDTEIIIHAGGLSERWYPVNHGRLPKPLTEIGKVSRPIIDWILLPYVKVGIKKFYISLWNNPDAVVNRCEQIRKETGIEFVYLMEPVDKRMGKAGVIKYYLSLNILNRTKPKLNVNASDLVNYDIQNFVEFHLKGLSNGFLGTIIGSKTGQTQFDKIVLDPKTKRVKKMVSKPPVILQKNEFANVGIAYFDSKLNNLFMKISDSELPVDWEKCSVSDSIFKVSGCIDALELGKNWFPLKTPHDYKKVNNVDLEKWFGIKFIKDYLGHY